MYHSILPPEVIYMGYIVSGHGHRPNPAKTKTILAAPVATNTMELKSFMGMWQYCSQFLPNLSSILAPLHQLLRKDERWLWGEQQAAAFGESKQFLALPACWPIMTRTSLHSFHAMHP